MAGVFWVASELLRRNWIALPTVRNQKGVDIIATTEARGASKFIELQVKTSQHSRAKFWMLGAKERRKIPKRESLFFVFVRPESTSKHFEAFVVPSSKVRSEASQNENKKFQCCWYLRKNPDTYKDHWNALDSATRS
jgi:hypothetical protein